MIKYAMRSFKKELRATLSLALPVALSQLGQMGMGLVDSFMVGKISPEALGAVGIANAYFFAVAVTGIGCILGLDYLVSHAFGANRIRECHYWLVQGTYLALFVSIPFSGLLHVSSYYFEDMGITPAVSVLARSYLQILAPSLVLFLLFAALRQYLQAMNHVRAVTFILVLANVLNAFLNWALIFGHCGFQAYGVSGSAFATLVSRVAVFLALVAYAMHYNKKENWELGKIRWSPHWQGLKQLIKLGGPAGMQMLLEVGVFSAATTLAGTLGAIPLAAHQIVLNIASFTFMVPLGISAAASVRVGQALGAKDVERAKESGWAALVLGVIFMSVSGLTLFFFGRQLAGIFTQSGEVIELSVRLLILAAIFQVFDGVQVVGTGALRGAQNTKLSMLANFIGYWIIGLPLGAFFCFKVGVGVAGVWLGLTAGLITVAVMILASWVRVTKSLN